MRGSRRGEPSRPSRIGLPRPTRAAWTLCLIGLGLLGAAVNTGNNLVYLLFGLAVAALPVSMAGSLLNLLRLDVEVRLPPSSRAGAPFTAEVTVSNRRRRVAARAIRVIVVHAEGEWGTGLAERIGPGERVRIVLVARAARRGPLRVTGVRLASTFPVGLLQRRRFFPRPDDILMLPARERGAASAQRGENQPGESRLAARAPGMEYEGLRPGREGEDTRRVDWKSTARTGLLMVRETTGEGRPVADVALSTRRRGEPGAARLAFESEVIRVAARGEAALDAGAAVTLTVDGRKSSLLSGPGGRRSLLETLARIEPVDEGGRPLPPLPLPPAPEPFGGPEKPLTAQAGRAAAAHRVDSGSRATPPGVSHRRSTQAALLVGAAALLAYGGIGPISFALLVLVLGWGAVSGRLPGEGSPLAARLWKAAALVALLVFAVDLLVFRGNPLAASLRLIVFIAVSKLFNSEGIRDDRQILLVSLMMMILAAALTTSVSFLVTLIAWLLAASHAQAGWSALPGHGPAKYAGLASRPRYRSVAAGSSVALLAVGAVVFLAVPHLGTGAFAGGSGLGRSATGFSESTRLGDIGRIKRNTARIMQVDVHGALPPADEIRWRGLALERFDGRTWSRTGVRMRWLTPDVEGRFVVDEALHGQAEVLVQDIRLDPIPARVLFAAAEPREVGSDDFNFLAADGNGGLLLPLAPSRRVRYTVRSEPPRLTTNALRSASGEDPPDILAVHLELPAIDPRIADLATRLTASAPTRYDAARAIETWLSTNLAYSLDVADAGRPDPLAAFLFDGMAGHCEYFATAMVVLARSRGIPARYVAGYLRGERSRFGPRFTVRQSDAHAWVEVYFPGLGWVPFDPTPAQGRDSREDEGLLTLAGDLYSTAARWWDDYVIGIDLEDQARGLLALRDAVAGTVGRTRARMRFWAGGAALPVMLLVAASLTLAIRWNLRLKQGRIGAAEGPASPRRSPRFYRRLLRLLAGRGLLRAPGETPAELAARAASSLSPVAARRLTELTDLYYRVRFEPARAERSAEERRVRPVARRLLADLRAEIAAASGSSPSRSWPAPSRL